MKRLRIRAKRSGHTIEEEAHNILREALRTEKEKKAAMVGLGTLIKNRFKDIGLDFDIPELRGQKARPAIFD